MTPLEASKLCIKMAGYGIGKPRVVEAIQKDAQQEILNKLKDFPFVYVGGGYFRDKRIKKGDNAPIVHGNEILTRLQEFIMV